MCMIIINRVAKTDYHCAEMSKHASWSGGTDPPTAPWCLRHAVQRSCITSLSKRITFDPSGDPPTPGFTPGSPGLSQSPGEGGRPARGVTAGEGGRCVATLSGPGCQHTPHPAVDTPLGWGDWSPRRTASSTVWGGGGVRLSGRRGVFPVLAYLQHLFS